LEVPIALGQICSRSAWNLIPIERLDANAIKKAFAYHRITTHHRNSRQGTRLGGFLFINHAGFSPTGKSVCTRDAGPISLVQPAREKYSYLQKF